MFDFGMLETIATSSFQGIAQLALEVCIFRLHMMNLNAFYLGKGR